MPRPPSIQWYYKQFLGDNKVLGMDWEALGMHVWLLNISIQETPPASLPNDMAVIRRWLRSPSEELWRRVQPQIFTAWTLRDGRWWNDGMKATVERAENYRSRYETGTRNSSNPMKSKEVKAFVSKETKGKDFLTQNEVTTLVDEQQAATFVCLELGISGMQARIKIFDSIKSYMHRESCDAEKAAESLVELWRQYEKADIPYKVGKGKFFEEGRWANPAEWVRRGEPSKAEQKRDATRANILNGLSAGPNARPSGADRGQRDFAGRSAALVGDVQAGESGTD
jgi:uncharacterized protein YdaU (DUF1376 family)